MGTRKALANVSAERHGLVGMEQGFAPRQPYMGDLAAARIGERIDLVAPRIVHAQTIGVVGLVGVEAEIARSIACKRQEERLAPPPSPGADPSPHGPHPHPHRAARCGCPNRQAEQDNQLRWRHIRQATRAAWASPQADRRSSSKPPSSCAAAFATPRRFSRLYSEPACTAICTRRSASSAFAAAACRGDHV